MARRLSWRRPRYRGQERADIYPLCITTDKTAHATICARARPANYMLADNARKLPLIDAGICRA